MQQVVAGAKLFSSSTLSILTLDLIILMIDVLGVSNETAFILLPGMLAIWNGWLSGLNAFRIDSNNLTGHSTWNFITHHAVSTSSFAGNGGCRCPWPMARHPQCIHDTTIPSSASRLLRWFVHWSCDQHQLEPRQINHRSFLILTAAAAATDPRGEALAALEILGFSSWSCTAHVILSSQSLETDQLKNGFGWNYNIPFIFWQFSIRKWWWTKRFQGNHG